MIKAYQSMQPLFDLGRVKAANRFISHQKSKTSPQIHKLTWDPLGSWEDEKATFYGPEEVRYTIYYTEDLRVNLASVCVMNEDVARAHAFFNQ